MVGTAFKLIRPNDAWAEVGKEIHPASARVLDQLRTHFTFQISVDVATLQQGLSVANAALKGGVNIVEMGTPLLKNEGVSNVVPAFRKQFSKALLLADMKTMDGGAFEARGVYAGGGNIAATLLISSRSPVWIRQRRSVPYATSSGAAAPSSHGWPLPISWCRSRARPGRLPRPRSV
jgi:Orotidine 5'-phosphate decarboxylase / HUMPS family